jgi:rubredoxin
MFVCTACGYLWKAAESPPEECPACAAPKEKYIPYDDRAERWVKRAVAQHVMYPDEEGADLRDENSALSSHIRFALVGFVEGVKKAGDLEG